MKTLANFFLVTLFTALFISCGSDSAINATPYRLGQGLAQNVLKNCDKNGSSIDMDCFYEKYKDYQPIIKMRKFNKEDLMEFEKGLKEELSKNGINSTHINIQE